MALGLRVLTEDTSQRATFKEYDASDTRTIFETVSFNVCNKRKRVHLRHLLNPKFMCKIPGHETEFVDII
jgi:hypothetical protein